MSFLERFRSRHGFISHISTVSMLLLVSLFGVTMFQLFGGEIHPLLADVLSLFYGGQYEQAAIDTANAFSYTISCSAIMHAFPTSAGSVGTDWGDATVADMNETWYEGPATPQINRSCHAATKNNGVAFGPTNVRVTCDELTPGQGMHYPTTGVENRGDCEVEGATLPQETSGNSIVDQWLKANGMPKYVLYYQALPVEAKKDYMMTTAPYKMWAIAIAAGGAMIPAAGAGLRAARGAAVGTRLSSKFYAGVRSVTGQSANWMFRRFTAMVGHRAVRSTMTMGNGLGAYTVRVSKYATRHFQSSVGRQVAGDWAASFSGKLARAMRENGIRYLTDENNVVPLVRQASRESGAAMSSSAARDIAARVATDFDWAVRLHDDFAATSRAASRRAATKFLLAAQSAADDTVGSVIDVGRRAARRGPGSDAAASYASKLNQYATRAEKTFTGRLPDRVSSASMRDAAIGSACHGFAARQEVAELATEAIQETFAENSEWLGETGVCAAYSGLASGGISSVCRAAGVSNVPSGWVGGGMTSTAACGFLVMAGHESMKATSTAVPTTPQHINSLYLARPWTGPEPFPLNEYAQWYFVKLNRQGSDNTRFHLMSPMYTRNLEDADDPRFVVDFDYTRVRQSSAHIIHDNGGEDAPARSADCIAGDYAIGWVDFWADGPPLFQQMQELASFIADSEDIPFKVSKDELAVKGISDGFQIVSTRAGCIAELNFCLEGGCNEARITTEPWVEKKVNLTTVPDGGKVIGHPPGWDGTSWNTAMATRLAVDPAWPVNPRHAEDDNGRRFDSLMQPPNVTQNCGGGGLSENGCDWRGGTWEFERPFWKYMFSPQARGAQMITDETATNAVGLPVDNLQWTRKHDVPTMTVRDVGFPNGKWEHQEAQHNFGYQGSQHEAEFWAAITRYGPLYVELAAAAVLAPFSGGTSLAIAFAATMAAMNGGGEYVSQAIGKDHAWPCHYNGCESLYPDELIPGVD